MGFYEEISKYYDYIFPAGAEQIQFIKEITGEAPKKILDIACGTGGYSIELAKIGYIVQSTDLDQEMVRLANIKALNEGIEINAFSSDMRYLSDKTKDKFDCVFCIGNSIVHLGSGEEIFKALTQMRNLLNKEGKLIIQVINFDRIMKLGIDELPSIHNDDMELEFIRKYNYNEDTGLIGFDTKLTVNGEVYINSVNLFPLKSEDLMKMLLKAGFKNINFYGDFKKSQYDENSYLLVVEAEAIDNE